MKTTDDILWWQKGIIYQIYPLSFADANGDGKGDLEGITGKLDYLVSLGITCIWLSPIYPSPFADFGYDISDYTGIHPAFGTIPEFDRLLDAVHAKGMKLLLDFVPNHTSDRHPWFEESRSSRDNPKRDWYLWHDPEPGGGPPNNWLSVFGGSAWQLDDTTGAYYYHAFLKEQPDLNWRNPEVREAMGNVMRFWLDRGVDGFRVDVMWHMIKDAELRNNPPNPEYHEGRPEYERLLPSFSTDQPEVHEVVAFMRAVTDEYEHRVILGEIYLPIHRLVSYYGEEAEGAQLPLNFQLLELPWNALTLNASISEYLASIPSFGWPNWVIGNHDRPRVATRVGMEQARVAAMLLLTLKGTPVMYYGDELGMRNVPIPPESRMDPSGDRRDPERTPMQWNGGKHAGFSDAVPWLPVSEDYRDVNVASESDDPSSTLAFYRKLIRLRQGEEPFMTGNFFPVGVSGDILAYAREDRDARPRFLVVLNLGEHEGSIDISPFAGGDVVLGTHPDGEGRRLNGTVALRGNEGLILKL